MLLLAMGGSRCLSLTEKLSLYERKRVAVDPVSNRLPLHVGLDHHNLNAFQKDFRIDFGHESLLIQNDFDCDSTIRCKVLNFEERSDTYNGTAYHYYPARAFVSFYRISPDEISDEVAPLVPLINFRYFTKTLASLPNVLGLAPNAQVWENWNEIFYFQNQVLNLTYSLQSDWPFLRFYSQIRPEHVLHSVAKSQRHYSFNPTLKFPNFEQPVKVCVEPNLPQYFSATPVIYRQILTAVCKDPLKCLTKDDLKPDYDSFAMEFKFFDPLTAKGDSVILYAASLLSFDNNNLRLDFAEGVRGPHESCDVVFHKKVFGQYYFLISNDLKDKETIRAGFAKIKPGDFFLLNLWKYMTWLLLFLVGLYVLYRFTWMKPARRQEEKEDDIYRQLLGSQTNVTGVYDKATNQSEREG